MQQQLVVCVVRPLVGVCTRGLAKQSGAQVPGKRPYKPEVSLTRTEPQVVHCERSEWKSYSAYGGVFLPHVTDSPSQFLPIKAKSYDAGPSLASKASRDCTAGPTIKSMRSETPASCQYCRAISSGLGSRSSATSCPSGGSACGREGRSYSCKSRVLDTAGRVRKNERMIMFYAVHVKSL